MGEDDIRAEYKRSDLGEGVRGKYYERYQKGINLVTRGVVDPVTQGWRLGLCAAAPPALLRL